MQSEKLFSVNKIQIKHSAVNTKNISDTYLDKN